MVFDSSPELQTRYSRYDGLLVGIGITIVLMFVGILAAQMLAIGSGVAGLILMFVAMFVIAPTETFNCRDSI